MSYCLNDPLQHNPVFKFRCRIMSKKGFNGRNIFTSYEDDDTPSDDAIKVFLRLKPTTDENGKIIEVLDSKTILFKMPPELVQTRKKLNIPDQYKFTFSNIFRSGVTQAEIFTGCVSNHVKDLFTGQHCLLFTYGTTNAGKTFTILGTGEQPGIIPRTLTTVFKSIKGKEYNNDRIRPHMFNSALEVTDETLQEETAFKQRILSWNPDKTQSESSRLTKTQNSHTTVQSSFEDVGESVFALMQKRLTNDTSIVEYEVEPEDRFSVWVSFGEIYNECIFDLLQPVTAAPKRKQLRLAQDPRKNTYIKGLKHVFVQSEEEAYKVLMFGKNNLQVAATGMNSRSSRSHCIFTIKLMKCANVDRPESVVVSSFSICDLAGAERQKKTLNVGLRLKESQNINCSLHVLSKCFSIIRENQMNNEHNLIPFRESKLTQLFQHALLGKESVTMIVNVNSEQHLCEETQHVLKASAIAKHIVVQPRPAQHPQRPKRTSTFSKYIAKHTKCRSTLQWDSCVQQKGPPDQSLDTVEENNATENETVQKEKEEQFGELLALVESLKEKLKEEKSQHCLTKKNWRAREDEIREEMRAELKEVLEKAKEQTELDIKRTQNITEEAGSRRGERVISGEDLIPNKKAKVMKPNDDEEMGESSKMQELLEEINVQKREIDGLISLVNMLRDEKKELTMNVTSLKLHNSWKDREIQNLKKKNEMFADESELKAGYLALEKEMNEKIEGRDKLLEEARYDLLEEYRTKDLLEKDIEKLEKELAEKEEENADLQTQVDDMYQDIADRSNTQDMLQNKIEEMEQNYEYDIKCMERKCTELEEKLNSKDNDYKRMERKYAELEEELNTKNEEIKKLNQLLMKNKEDIQFREKVEEDTLQLKAEIERLLCEKALSDELLLQKNKAYSELQEEVSNKEKEHSSEMRLMEQSLKQQIQESVRLAELKKNKEIAVKKLSEELKKVKSDVDDVKESLKKKERDLECSLSKITGFESSVPALEVEFERKHKEMSEYKKRCEDLTETMFNMEQEAYSFQANQKEIIGKYEEQLKKTKEENDTLKKEVAKVANMLYKSTPTPKKDLEKQIEVLKKQLEESQSMCQMLQEAASAVNKTECRLTTPTDNQLELRCEAEALEPRNRALSATCSGTKPLPDNRTSKSALKARTRRGARTMNIPSVTVSDYEHGSNLYQTLPTSQPQRTTRKKLWDASSNNETISQFEEIDAEHIPQDSPGTIIKRNLRSRNK